VFEVSAFHHLRQWHFSDLAMSDLSPQSGPRRTCSEPGQEVAFLRGGRARQRGALQFLIVPPGAAIISMHTMAAVRALTVIVPGMDGLRGSRGAGVASALLQHEDGNLETAEVGGGLAEAVRWFLAGIADEDDGVDLGSERLLAAVQ
jgi:hypothetical protein